MGRREVNVRIHEKHGEYKRVAGVFVCKCGAIMCHYVHDSGDMYNDLITTCDLETQHTGAHYSNELDIYWCTPDEYKK